MLLFFPGLPIVHPAVVAAGGMDAALRRHGGGGDRGQPCRYMDSAGQ